MPKTFKIGDHMRWNSEAGRVSGLIIKKITSDTKFKGYVRHASREAPQYLIKSDKTEHRGANGLDKRLPLRYFAVQS